MDTRFDTNELKNACLVINTADYCYTTTQEVCSHAQPTCPSLIDSTYMKLEEKLRQRIIEEFKGKITLQAECDLFIRSGSSCVRLLSVLSRIVLPQHQSRVCSESWMWLPNQHLIPSLACLGSITTKFEVPRLSWTT